MSAERNPLPTNPAWHTNTKVVLAGQQTDGHYRSIAPPIYQTANFRFLEPGSLPQFDYTRSGNPTRSALEQILAELEGGAGAVALGTGMGAITTVLGLLDGGAHVVCSHDCYGGTARLLRVLEEQGKLEVTFADLTDPNQIGASIRRNTRMLWVETPSNPLLRITDLEAVTRCAASAGILSVVDNTFLSPLFQRPLDFGADLVVHSTTKYLNGHSDVIGGAVVSRTAELHERIAFLANTLGTAAAPFDSWLVLRGIKTLPLRARRHEENALAVARWLEEQPSVRRVFYPGLPSHEGYELACRQQRGFGGVVSFELDGTNEDVHRVIGSTRIFALAESLGGVESLIEQPSTMSHAAMGPELRAKAGIGDTVIRLSVGVEEIEDLIQDLDQAIGQGERIKAKGEKELEGLSVEV